MSDRATIVLDVGKTLSKLSLWTTEGRLLERRCRPNARINTGQYIALDTDGIERWLVETLSEFARITTVGAIIPVGHGAAAAVVRGDALLLPPVDYEHPLPEVLRHIYDAQRDPFVVTGSPALPNGLNLGAQLAFLESLNPDLFRSGATVMPWPQYWSWLLSGMAASEVTSLGCHTDLWRPLTGTYSALSVTRGWAERMAPLQAADTILGPIKADWATRTGLPRDVRVYCGLHDSNAALLSARGFPELSGYDATVLSTGTWFVAMRTPGRNCPTDIASLAEGRDCLVNVDVLGKPVPSARFMGGREIDLLTGIDTPRIDNPPDQPALVDAVSEVVEVDAMVLPTRAPGTGPYPFGRGRWNCTLTDQTQTRAAICVYAALVADASLDLIGAQDRLLIEGRFAGAEAFVRALATLRPDTELYTSNAHCDVSFGALRLLNPQLPPPSALIRIAPLSNNLCDYRQRWRQEAAANPIPACGD